MIDAREFMGFGNASVAIPDDKVLEHIRTIQRIGQIKPSDTLDGRYNLTVEMETGMGKVLCVSLDLISFISYHGQLFTSR